MDVDRLGPRHDRSAARVAAGLFTVSSVAVLLGEAAVLAAGTRKVLPAALVTCVLLAAIGVVLWYRYTRLPSQFWFALALGSVGIVVLLDLLTDDAGGGAQVAFVLPVVYAGAFLRTTAAWIVSAAAAVGNAVVAFALLPTDRALTDHFFVLVAICSITWVLVASGRRQDALVAQLRAVASVDGLTGLATRRVLESSAERVLEARRATGTAPVGIVGVVEDGGRLRRSGELLGTALLLIDLDNFKDVNDAHGHPVGDEVLVHVGRLLRSAVRRSDTVARFGGDELAVLVPEVTREESRRLAEKLREVVQRNPMRGSVGEIALTVSIGVAHACTGDGGMDELYRAADDALYRAKRDGRDRVIVLDPGQVAVEDEAVS